MLLARSVWPQDGPPWVEGVRKKARLWSRNTQGGGVQVCRWCQGRAHYNGSVLAIAAAIENRNAEGLSFEPKSAPENRQISGEANGLSEKGIFSKIRRMC